MQSEKIDKRKLVSPQRLEHLQNMSDKLAVKKVNDKENKLKEMLKQKFPEKFLDEALDKENKLKEMFKEKFPEKFLDEAPKEESIQDDVEEDDEEEIVVPPKKTAKKKRVDINDDIKAYVDSILPPELSPAARKQRKWEARKTEINNEIIESLSLYPEDVQEYH